MHKKILLLIGPDFHDIEFMYTKYRLEEEGFETLIGGIGEKSYKGKFGYPVNANGHVKEYNPKEFHGVFIPGGWAPDKIRQSKEAIEFVKAMNEEKKAIAAICHGAWVLASADVIKGKNVTCYAACRDDVINAGAKYHDEVCIVDGNIITSRKPDDLPIFVKEFIRILKK